VLRDFAYRRADADISVVYSAGHGIEVALELSDSGRRQTRARHRVTMKRCRSDAGAAALETAKQRRL